MKPIILVTTLSLTASTVCASGHVLARKAPSLQPRVTFQGGWPIEADTCPSNTTECSNTGSCCPNGTDCYTAGLAGVAVCCPNTNDCSQTANTLPVCADPSWTLYVGNYYFFCCSAGQIGILPNPEDDVGAGLCVQSGSNVAATQLASVYGAGAAPSASSTASAAVSNPATTATAITTLAGVTASSSLAGTTITPKSAGTATGTSPGTSSTPSTGTGSSPGTGKSNDSAKSSFFPILCLTFGFLLIPFGM